MLLQISKERKVHECTVLTNYIKPHKSNVIILTTGLHVFCRIPAIKKSKAQSVNCHEGTGGREGAQIQFSFLISALDEEGC
jgi:hypothetical protein